VPQPITPAQFHKYDTTIPKGLGRYVFWQYVVVILGTSAFLVLSGMLKKVFEGWEATFWLLGIAGLIYLSIANLGALLTGKAWGAYVEMLRVSLTAAVLAYFAWDSDFVLSMAVTGGTYVIASLAWLSQYDTALQVPPHVEPMEEEGLQMHAQLT
jgi:hypothetical protein